MGNSLQNQLDVAQKNKAVSAHKNVSRDLDALILKFRGYWDGRYEPDGKLRFFDVQYFLEDDTIEILEEIEDNSKSHGVTHKRFVKRQRLPAVRFTFPIVRVPTTIIVLQLLL